MEPRRTYILADDNEFLFIKKDTLQIMVTNKQQSPNLRIPVYIYIYARLYYRFYIY